MRQKLEPSPTKQRILDSAQNLMMAKGYAGTSVDEVCSKAKVTKGNFFYYFKSKEQLGKELMERFAAGKQDEFCCASGVGGKDPLKRIYACIDLMAEMAERPDFQGCLIGTLSQEGEAIGPKLRSICCRSFEEGTEFFRREFEEAKQKHAPKAAIDAKKLADFFLSTVQGSFVLMKAKGGDRTVVPANLKLMKAFLQSIFGH
jgi:TetR/AcrR family transcriptional repressor of nem operon